MQEVCAPSWKLTVVSAKKPRHWIVRGISNYTPVDKVRKEVERFVGQLDQDIEWTCATYRWPGYLDRPDVQRGIWYYGFSVPEASPWGYPDHWKEEWSQYREGPTLMSVPSGW